MNFSEFPGTPAPGAASMNNVDHGEQVSLLPHEGAEAAKYGSIQANGSEHQVEHVAPQPRPPWTFWGCLKSCFSFLMPRSRTEGEGNADFGKVEQINRNQINSPKETRITQGSEVTMGALKNGQSCIRVDIPKAASIVGGASERQCLSDYLMERATGALKISAPAEQTRKDITDGRIKCTLGGNAVTSIEQITAFLGDAAKTIIPILNQNIGVDANKVLREHILLSAPSGTTYATPAGSDINSGELSVGIEKVITQGAADRFMIKFFNADNMKSVTQKKTTQQGKSVMVSIELDDASLGSIDGMTKTEQQAITCSTKRAEIAVTLEVVKQPSGTQAETADHDASSYSINCLELSNSYKITNAPKRWWFF